MENTNPSQYVASLTEAQRKELQIELARLAQDFDNDAPKKPQSFPPTRETVRALISHYNKDEVKLAYELLYLGGQRITEALALQRKNVTIEEKEGREYLVLFSKTLKNRIDKFRRIPIPMFGWEEDITKAAWNRIQKLEPEQYVIHHYSRNNWANKLSTVSIRLNAISPNGELLENYPFNIHPHILRHWRASHMAEEKPNDQEGLRIYFGWSSPIMPAIYCKRSWRSLARLFENRPEIRET